jgi:type IV secretory pathway VirB4 component
MAIMGKPGVGKTQFLLKILADIRIQSQFQTNFIFFDYKGDVVENESFVETTRARCYKLLQNSESLPINPFILASYDEQSILVSAREKAESFASINTKFGVVQKGALTEAIVAAYSKRQGSETPYPDFQDVLEIANLMYEEDGKRDDSLIEVLRDLAKFHLFWAHGSAVKPIEKVAGRTMVIDVHAMPVLKELVGYLVIERLYKEMASLPDSQIKDGRRTLRTILVIDEAHNYLGQKNIFLQRIIREGRSKGIVVFFASQSPTDYQQKEAAVVPSQAAAIAEIASCTKIINVNSFFISVIFK